MRFNPITLRIALSVFSRCPAAYKALKKFDVLSLPSEETLKSYIRNYRHGTGLNSGYERVMNAYKEKFSQITSGIKPVEVVKDGWIIMDQTKIVAGIVWNCNSGNIDGFAMIRRFV
eukprot:Pompholyxophrys_punicea_v1_NODE_1061_length_999_cov_5.770127.p2 type:complete len:116 gc:universal NODE_1061_length_999_cov_5.770127:590-243(-)